MGTGAHGIPSPLEGEGQGEGESAVGAQRAAPVFLA